MSERHDINNSVELGGIDGDVVYLPLAAALARSWHEQASKSYR